ncbi:LOW QUALITY PROTEIN: DNA-binding response regulator [Bacillus sp. JCM 19046]|nr:LOW QUALITY PROTEIN: DNA-binding response regulator [Bacillus sp. JCM 19046]
MKSRTVLVVDDEPELLKLVVTYLKNHSYLAITAGTGEEALQVIQEREVDLVILDIMMEGMDGFAVCETIRRNYALPVIMLTARSHEEDKIRALKLGADDYIVKPFSPKELMVESKQRYAARMSSTRRISWSLGSCLIDTARMVQVDQKELVLTRREYDLLLFLAEHKNRSFSREQLFTNVWTDVSTSSLRTVDTHIKTLRLKLGTSGKRIQTVWGVGYKFGERE